MRGLDIDVRQSPPPPVEASPPDDTLARATVFGVLQRVERGKVPVSKLNCAGQGCAQRDECRRYTVMVPCGKRLDAEGREHPVFEWASFDIERMAMGGECPVFVRPVVARDIRR